MSFAKKTVVVTGGTGALGQVVCEAFLAQGANVHSRYIEERELGYLPAALTGSDRFHTARVQLDDEAQVSAWLEGIGSFDVVVNIAGGFAMNPFVETSLADWRRMFDMNLTSVFLTSRQALRHFQGKANGRVITIGAFAAARKAGGMAAYTTSKAAVIHLTEVLAEETLASGITVNAILPTVMDTPANRKAMPDADVASWVPPRAVADTILFLCRDESWPITGACIPLRGHC